MFSEYRLLNVWLTTALWMIIYLSDYYLTIYGARLIRTHLAETITYEGSLELTPVFQKDVDRLRKFSPAFYLRLLVSAILLPAIWYLSLVLLGMPQFFLFAAGGLFLREAVVHLRHFRTIALALFARDPSGMQGKIHYARWFNLKVSGVEILSFAGFYLLLAGALGSWFFLGGAVSCLVTGLSHWRMSRKSYRVVLEKAV
jgi:hypothetical protein